MKDKDKDYVIVAVVGVLILSTCAVIVYFGFDFLSHVAERIGYPQWKMAVLYFTTVFLIVAGSIVGNK